MPINIWELWWTVSKFSLLNEREEAIHVFESSMMKCGQQWLFVNQIDIMKIYGHEIYNYIKLFRLSQKTGEKSVESKSEKTKNGDKPRRFIVDCCVSVVL